MTPDTRYILLDDQISETVRFYEDPIAVLRADTAEAVESVFQALAEYHRQGYYLAGYCAYELGYALEPKLKPAASQNSQTPLLVFGVFQAPRTDMPLSLKYAAHSPDLNLTPFWSEAEYLERFETVISYIKSGDIYQANLTFPAQGDYSGSADTLYASLRRRQPGHFGGVLRLFETDIISFSPELFFKKSGDQMSMRPMKGTRPRHQDPDTDKALISDMQAEPKSRAENLMIVDLLRNDLSRISKPGSVKVPELFSVETYPTLHQMISKVDSTLKADTSFRDIFTSLFPCGSVTGAPKIRAMEIIKDLESTPRGAYCGSMGYIDPDGTACFNVGIRTISLKDKRLTYGIGSGVVFDSDGPDEYRECLLKAEILTPAPPVLIETFLWSPDTGFTSLDAHLTRLEASARAKHYAFDAAGIRTALDAAVLGKTQAQRMRLTLTLTSSQTLNLALSLVPKLTEAPAGNITVDAVAFEAFPLPLKLAISKHPLTPDVQETAHKTSSRTFYDEERKRLQGLCGADEVLFLNAEGFLCEGSFTSLFIQRDETLLTPSLSCGLLPGILRAEMLDTGAAQPASLTIDDLHSAKNIYVGNSLRGFMPAKVLFFEPR